MTDSSAPSTGSRTGTGARTGARARPNLRRPPDVVPVLSGFAVILLALPSRYVFGPLGGAGAPAQVLGLAAGLWWAVHWLAQHRPETPLRQPLRAAAFAYLLAVLVSYVVAARRPISPDEMSQADRGLLIILSGLGVLLVTMDGITTREGLDKLLRRLTLLGCGMAGLGVLQFFTGRTYTEYLKLPGLTESGALSDVGSREGFFRPMGTALHAIEFGVIMTALLPIALHFAMVDRHKNPVVRWAPVIAIAVALPISISRSAILGGAVGLLTLLPTWPRSHRRRIYAAGTVMLGSMFVVLPGFLGSLLGLFTNIGNDSSAQSRTDSYAIAWSFIVDSPIFGRGVATFMPSYRILDNQYLASLIETGIFGLGTLLIFFVTGIVTAWQIRDTSPGPMDQVPTGAGVSLGPAIAAGIAACTLSFALFDALSFSMATSLMFLLLGAAGAARRLAIEGDRPLNAPWV